MYSTVTASVHMTAAVFRHFASFDSFRLKKRWKSPLIFTGIMVGFALICFLSGKKDSLFMGSVLLIVGLGLPGVWFGTYFSQLAGQIRALKLDHKASVPVYTLRMGKDEIRIHNDLKPEPEQLITWNQVQGVWRGKDAWYLYVAANKAFILPDGCYGLEPMEMHAFLQSHLPEEKLHARTAS